MSNLNDKLTDILNAIEDGQLDDRLPMIQDVVNTRIRDRRQKAANKARRELKPGDTISLTGIRPKYANGKTAEVVRINRSRIVVRMLEDAGKFRKGQKVTVPAVCVEQIG